MAPKNTNAADDGRTIAVLCNLIMSCDEFKADMTKMTAVLGLSHQKNAPRAINSLIGPHGYEFKAGKVSKKGGAAAAAAVATPETAAAATATAAAATAAATPETAAATAVDAGKGNGDVDESLKAALAEPPKTKKAAATHKARKALPSKPTKKRKIEEEKDDGGASKEEKGSGDLKEEIGSD